jgi:hypothetical protein
MATAIIIKTAKTGEIALKLRITFFSQVCLHAIKNGTENEYRLFCEETFTK